MLYVSGTSNSSVRSLARPQHLSSGSNGVGADSPCSGSSTLNLHVLVSLFRYKQHQPADTVTENLKKLLTYCEDIYLYYKLAYEHKFYEIVNVLLKDPQTGCCLKDMLAG